MGTQIHRGRMIRNQLKAESYCASFILTFFWFRPGKREKMSTTLKEKTLGQRLKAARTRKGMTQEALAEAMLTTKSMISYYENDHGDMKQSMIEEFADVLGTTVEYLICGVIKTPELDADSVELLKLFGAMDEKTRQIMLVQMRAVAYI